MSSEREERIRNPKHFEKIETLPTFEDALKTFVTATRDLKLPLLRKMITEEHLFLDHISKTCEFLFPKDLATLVRSYLEHEPLTEIAKHQSELCVVEMEDFLVDWCFVWFREKFEKSLDEIKNQSLVLNSISLREFLLQVQDQFVINGKLYLPIFRERFEKTKYCFSDGNIIFYAMVPGSMRDLDPLHCYGLILCSYFVSLPTHYLSVSLQEGEKIWRLHIGNKTGTMREFRKMYEFLIYIFDLHERNI